MIRLKTIIDRVQGQLIDNSSETRELIIGWTNAAVERLCRIVPVPVYVARVELTPDSDGIVFVPGSVHWLRDVSATDGRKFEYYQNYHANIRGYNYVEAGALFENGDTEAASVVHGSNTVTVAAGTDCEVNDVIRLTGVDGLYDVLSIGDPATTLTIAPWYEGETANDISLTRFPQGIRRIRVSSGLDSPFTETVVITFQRRPAAVSQDDDIILLEAPDSIFLNVMKRAMERGKYNVDSLYLDRDIQRAELMELGTVRGDSEKLKTGTVFSRPGIFTRRRRL